MLLSTQPLKRLNSIFCTPRIFLCIQLCCICWKNYFSPLFVDASTSGRIINHEVFNTGAFISYCTTRALNHRRQVVNELYHNYSKIGLTNKDKGNLKEPQERESNFGRQKYWNDFYEEKGEFSWYSPWSDISPFFMELVPLQSTSKTAHGDDADAIMVPPRVLLPGIGNDSSMVDMYDDGYTHLTAFDYAEEGVECAKKFFGERLLMTDRDSTNAMMAGVDLSVADARNLPYPPESFDGVLEKGTLDAIYLSGGKDKELASSHLNMAVAELTRVVCSGGVVMSISAACADAVEKAFASHSADWEMIRDGDFYMTEDGFSSNNIDATIFAWKKR